LENRPLERLEEINEVEQEFLVKKPNGYIPKYCPPIKYVQIEDVLLKFLDKLEMKLQRDS